MERKQNDRRRPPEGIRAFKERRKPLFKGK
jgi:hypothetical protein